MSTFAYFPHTEDDIKSMLERIGVSKLDDLYADVPEKFMYRGEYDLPDAMSEQQVRDFFAGLDAKDIKLKVFAGAGAYDHYTPSVIPYICSRSEFLTAYTPYQAEISQGTLRYIFEYQSMICALTGMDISNASMYDGPTAAAEAMKMAVASTKKKNRVLLSDTLLPNVRRVVATYAKFHGIELGSIKAENGQTSLESLKQELQTGDVAGIIVPALNRYGIIEDFTGFAEAVHEAKALVVEYCDPSALAVVKTPGEWDFDIAVGDGQSLGIPLCYGGPYVGFMACRKDYVRKMPGRIVGQTEDAQGRRCFVLTLQAREQHIRRQKATSNICSNQSLMALWVTIYMATMGKKGLREAAQMSCDAAHYLAEALCGDPRFTLTYDKPFFNEFCVTYDGNLDELLAKLAGNGIFGGVKVADNVLMIAVTEKRTKEEIDQLISLCHEQ